jgi:hypothetical protein
VKRTRHNTGKDIKKGEVKKVIDGGYVFVHHSGDKIKLYAMNLIACVL